MAHQLTPGGVQRLFSEVSNESIRLQVLGCKTYEGKSTGQGVRYKVLLSDGVQSTKAVLATQLAHLRANNEINYLTVVDVHDSISQMMEQKQREGQNPGEAPRDEEKNVRK